jgi:hypothetical protein
MQQRWIQAQMVCNPSFRAGNSQQAERLAALRIFVSSEFAGIKAIRRVRRGGCEERSTWQSAGCGGDHRKCAETSAKPERASLISSCMARPRKNRTSRRQFVASRMESPASIQTSHRSIQASVWTPALDLL